MGQDGHDRGQKIIASAFADLGFDVEIGPLFATPEEVAALAAAKTNAHIVGVSSLAAGHLALAPALKAALREVGLGDAMIVVGGVIPEQDFDAAARGRGRRDIPAGNGDRRSGGEPDRTAQPAAGLHSARARVNRLPFGGPVLRLNAVVMVIRGGHGRPRCGAMPRRSTPRRRRRSGENGKPRV